MTILMTYGGPGEPEGAGTRTGGTPLAPAGTAWPRCSTCGGPMQFLAHLRLDDLEATDSGHRRDGTVMAVFMCQNDPGMCDEWSAEAGGNRALLFPAEGLAPMPAPALDGADEEVLRLGAVSAVALVPSPALDYRDARAEWTGRTGNGPRDVLGQLGGEPEWIQDDETPRCAACARPMELVAQFEEGRDHATAMNFGSGTAFAFRCAPCGRAAFLWQC